MSKIAHTKILIVVVMIAMAVGQAVTEWKDALYIAGAAIGTGLNAYSRPQKMSCTRLKNYLGLHTSKSSQDVLDWAERYTSNKQLSEPKLFKSWKTVLEGDCAKSWEHVSIVANCIGGTANGYINRPLTAYATRCVNLKEVSNKINSEARSLSSRVADFISAQFIETYRKDNPDDLPLAVNFGLSADAKMCCSPKKAGGAVIEAIEKEFTKKHKKPEDEFKKFFTLSDYLQKNLDEPCEQYKRKMDGIVKEFVAISNVYDGGHATMVKALDEEAKNALFRYAYCHQATWLGQRLHVLNFVAAHLNLLEK